MKPKFGMPATILYPTDRYPYLVTYISKNGYKIQLTGIDTNELTSRYNKTGFPISDYILTDEQLRDVKLTKELKFAYRGKDGNYHCMRCPIVLGEARYYRDLSD